MDTKHIESGWVYMVIFNDLGMCGCGMYDERIVILKEVMNAFPLYEEDKVPTYLRTALGEWFLCALDKAKLIEHGSTIGGSWLTEKGKRLLTGLNDPSFWNELNDDVVGICNCSECTSLWP